MGIGPVGGSVDIPSVPDVAGPEVVAESNEAQQPSTPLFTQDLFDRSSPASPDQTTAAAVALSTGLGTFTVAQAMRGEAVAPSAPSDGDLQDIVRTAYQDVLLRAPDDGGMAQYTAELRSMAAEGSSAALLSESMHAELRLSPEAAVVAAVNDTFQSELGRTPTEQGYWHTQAKAWLDSGVAIDEIGARVKSGLDASPEHALQHPEEYLNGVYQRLLGRDADGAGVETYSALMRDQNAQGVPFDQISAQIEQQITQSPEYAARQATTTQTTGVGNTTGADAELAAKVDGFLAGTGLAGQGSAIVQACRTYRVPIDFAMSQLQKESSFLSPENNLSVANNNPGNLRFASWEAELGGTPGEGNFTHFPSVAKGIEAQIRLLGSETYRAAVDARDWKSLIYTYCPPSDQPGGKADTDLYVQQMQEWTATWQQKLGVDDRWVNGASAAPAATPPAQPSAGKDLHGITPSQRYATQFADQWSLCGPIAATAAARALGMDMSIERARAVGLQGGNYVDGDGMRGTASEVRMLSDLGIASHIGTLDDAQIQASLAAGKPVILSTPKHYFVIEAYDPATGKYDFGESALALKASGGQTQFTLSQVANLGNGQPEPIYLD